ncbi:MAG: hypothetical protein ACLRPT_10710 [Akkermansia muciniphila]
MQPRRQCRRHPYRRPYPHRAVLGPAPCFKCCARTRTACPAAPPWTPRYPVRGFMLDIARTPYPLSYLKDLIRTMSW